MCAYPTTPNGNFYLIFFSLWTRIRHLLPDHAVAHYSQLMHVEMFELKEYEEDLYYK